MTRCGLRERERQRRHGARVLHAAGVLRLAEDAARSAGNVSSSNVRSRITCRCASVSDASAASSRSACSSRIRRVKADRLRAARSSAIAEVLLALRVALLAVVKVGAIADLVLRDPHQPAEQRAAVLALEVVQVLEGLEERRPAGCRATPGARAGCAPSSDG